MKKIRIVADSTCDLSAELLAKYDIPVIPLSIIMDDKSYYDGKGILKSIEGVNGVEETTALMKAALGI